MIFATYPIRILLALLAVGRLSDQMGRRRVLLFAVVLALISAAFASGIAWLLAARLLQGLAVGAFTEAATAALVELYRGCGGKGSGRESAVVTRSRRIASIAI